MRSSMMGMLALSGVIAALAFAGRAAAEAPAVGIASFTVGADEKVVYPNTTFVNLPDEHTTFMPLPCDQLARCGWLVFGASLVQGGTGGAVVMVTHNLRHFDLATAFGYADQVMTPPVPFTQCNSKYNVEFDENYAAPGSVLPDPTLPAGNLIMLYEAENHCPGGVWQQPFYATVGFARSSDAGKTWPKPVDREFGGKDRYPVLKLPAPEPPSEPMPAAMGDALPSGYVDTDNRVYAVYAAPQGPGAVNDGLLRIARANLADPTVQAGGRVHFKKWLNGGFTSKGVGGDDSGFLPSRGCPTGFQAMADLSYNDDLHQYLLVYVCASLPDKVGAWYYSTATSLDKQDWIAPQLIAGSQFPLTAPCPGITSGAEFDGWYPSLVSPGAAQGHTKKTGKVFLLNGCDTGKPRAFVSRRFTITTQ
jgi:hypothetical protein